MMQQLTLITYLFSKENSVKNDQRFSICIPTGNSCFPPSFNFLFNENL